MRVREPLVNLLLAVTAALGLLLLLEAGFRVRAQLLNRGILSHRIDPPIDPPADGPAELGHLIRLSDHRRIIYELKPNLTADYQGARVITNRWGFRGPDHPPAKDDDVRRIVGLGDSFMFGYGVAGGETYLALLEARLNQAAAGRWQVINTAVPGYNTAMEVETLKHKGLRFSPDLVIIEFVGNDLALPNFIRVEEPVWATDRSLLVDYFKERRARSRKQSLYRRLTDLGIAAAPEHDEHAGQFLDDPQRVPPAYRDMVGWEGFAAALAELRRLQQEHGFTVVWITLMAERRPLQAFRRARRHGFLVLDVGKTFRHYLADEGFGGYLGSPLAQSATDGHPSALGHRITAATIYDFLARQGLLAARPGDELGPGRRHSSSPPPSQPRRRQSLKRL